MLPHRAFGLFLIFCVNLSKGQKFGPAPVTRSDRLLLWDLLLFFFLLPPLLCALSTAELCGDNKRGQEGPRSPRFCLAQGDEAAVVRLLAAWESCNEQLLMELGRGATGGVSRWRAERRGPASPCSSWFEEMALILVSEIIPFPGQSFHTV